MEPVEPSEEEIKTWVLWKKTFKSVFGRVIKEMDDGAGVSDGDYIVLELLSRSDTGQLRQQQLGDAMEWTKSRLSHHLTRMEKRSLITRRTSGNGAVQVRICPAGKHALAVARPIVHAGIRKHFLNLLTERDKESIARLAAKAGVE